MFVPRLGFGGADRALMTLSLASGYRCPQRRAWGRGASTPIAQPGQQLDVRIVSDADGREGHATNRRGRRRTGP